MLRAVWVAATSLIALAGCGGSQTDGSPATEATQTEAAQPDTASMPAPRTPVITGSAVEPTPAAADAVVPPAPPADAASPPPAPPPVLTPKARKGEKGARNVLLTWARALENHQFGTAWEQFGSPPASRAAYTRWWQRYRTITVALGDGTVEGAAGSLYYEVRATLTGTEPNGRPFRLEGPVVVRRVNDVDGATPAQLRWHIESADLQTTH